MASSSHNNGGYDYQFVPPLDEDFISPICYLAMRDPVQTTVCGHLFCAECLKKFHESLRQVCPMDNLELSAGQIFPDINMKRKILASTVLCPNTGCEWIGELSQLDKHRKDCLFERVTCLYSECSLEISRNELEEHMASECGWRECQCYYCEALFPFCRKKDHEDSCKRFPVKCTSSCSANLMMPREELESHLENRCPLTRVECAFKDIGCEDKVPRCQLDQHVQSSTQTHLISACKKISEMSDKIVLLNQELVNQKRIIKEIVNEIYNPIQAREHLKRLYDSEKEMEMDKNASVMAREMEPRNKKTVLVWEIQNFEKSIPQPILISPSFSVKPRGHLFNVVLRHCLSRSSLSIEFWGNVSDSRLVWPFEKRMLITIINQEDDGHEWDITLDEEVHITQPEPSRIIDASYEFERSFSLEEFYHRKYIVDDKLVIHVEVVNN